MTRWLGWDPRGRDRGPVALAGAWVAVLTRPRAFFRTRVAPGDQAPGLVFAGGVVLLEEASRVAVVELAARGLLGTGPFTYSGLVGLGPLERLVVVVATVLLVVPATLHLIAAVQTLLVAPVAPDRGGVSETVQTVAYATAPCVFAGLPVPAVRVVCALWGAGLYVVGVGEVHDLSLPRAFLVAGLPALFVFGYAFRGIAAASALG